jgi:dTDP-glucose 4,6-dehydratase
LVRSYFKTYGFPSIVTRCTNNYGPYQFPEKLIPLMYLKARAKDVLPVYGDGGNIRDWIHVQDHCRGVELALRQGRPGKVYNFGGNTELSNLELVKAILAELERPQDLIRFVADRPGHDRRYAIDFSQTGQELGWEPEIPFAQGLSQTLGWYAQHPKWLQDVQSGAYLQFMTRWYQERS